MIDPLIWSEQQQIPLRKLIGDSEIKHGSTTIRQTFEMVPPAILLNARTNLLANVKKHIKTSGIDPRYDICYFSDNIFILYLMITPGLDLSNDARGTENCNSVPVGTEFQKLSKIS